MGNACIWSRNLKSISIVRPPLYMNLLVLSSSILHVCCRNPRWSKSQAVHCLCQLTHLEVFVLKQLQFNTSSLLCREHAANRLVETYCVLTAIILRYFHFYSYHGQESQMFWSMCNVVSSAEFVKPSKFIRHLGTQPSHTSQKFYYSAKPVVV